LKADIKDLDFFHTIPDLRNKYSYNNCNYWQGSICLHHLSCFSSKLYVLGATDVDLESASHSLTSTHHFIILSLEPKSSPINQEALDRGLSVWQDALSVPFHLRYHPPSKDGDPLQTHLSFDIWSPFVFYSCLNTVGEINGTRKGNLATLTPTNCPLSCWPV
jgi:hypothetical protein